MHLILYTLKVACVIEKDYYYDFRDVKGMIQNCITIIPILNEDFITSNNIIFTDLEKVVNLIFYWNMRSNFFIINHINNYIKKD